MQFILINNICYLQKITFMSAEFTTSYIKKNYFVRFLYFSHYFQINYPVVSSIVSSESYKYVLIKL